MGVKEYEPKSINGLMRHLRDNCGVSISGSAQKKKLGQIGYYHGYKGYRFVKTGRSRLPLSSFSEVETLYNFDTQVKALLYPWIMRVETSIKNLVLECICRNLMNRGLDASYEVVCKNCLGGRGVKKRYEELSYLSKKVSQNAARTPVGHFAAASRDVPIWALFEVLTLGDFIQVYDCLDMRIKDDIYAGLGMPARNWNRSQASRAQSTDFLLHLLNAFKTLRNAVAHNSVVLDARFSVRDKPSHATGTYFGAEFGLQRIAFDELIDYVMVVAFFMRVLGFSRRDTKQLVASFEKTLTAYRSELPQVIFDRVIGRSYVLKVKAALAHM